MAILLMMIWYMLEGKEDELYGRLQQRVGKTKEEMKSEIDKL